MKHPNATAVYTTGTLTTLVIFVLSLVGVTVSGEVGAAIATVTAATVLFIGRNGLRGIARMLWRGQG